MKLRILAAALALPMLAMPLQGCITNPDGTVVLAPDARTKLETALRWAKRAKAGADMVIVGINTTCAGSTSDFCAKAVPIVAIANAVVELGGKAIDAAERALAAQGTPEEQLARAAADLIKFEQDVEDFIRDLKATKGATAEVRAVLAQAEEVQWDARD